MERIYKPKPKLYTESSINTVIEVCNGKPVYKTAKKYHMSTSMLRKRVMENNGPFSRKKKANFRPQLCLLFSSIFYFYNK